MDQTSSEAESKEGSPPEASDLNSEMIEKTFAQAPIGVPTNNFELAKPTDSAGFGSTGSNRNKASSDEMEEDQQQAIINRQLRQKGLKKLDDSQYNNKNSFDGFDTVENDFKETHFKMSHNDRRNSTGSRSKTQSNNTKESADRSNEAGPIHINADALNSKQRCQVDINC